MHTLLMHMLVCIVALIPALAPPEQDQDPLAPRVERPERDPALDRATIQTTISRLQAIAVEERSEDESSELLRLEGTLRALDQAETEWAKALEFQQLTDSAPDQIEEIKAKLLVPIEELLPDLPADMTVEGLTATLQSATASLASEQAELEDLERLVNARAGRRQEILRLLPATTEELRSLEEALATAADTAQDRSTDEAIRVNRLARKEAAEARIVRLNAENQAFSTITELQRLRRDHAQRDVAVAQQVVDELQGRLDRIRQDQADQARQEAEAELAGATGAHALVVTLLEENAELTSENQRVLARLGTLAEESRFDKAKLARWSTELDHLRVQEERFGLSEAVGMRLRSQQAVLPNLSALQGGLEELEGELARTSERYFELSAYSNAETVLEDVEPAERAAAEPGVRDALARRQVLVQDLRATYEELLDDLVSAHQERQTYAEVVREYSEFIQERVFWLRSAAPFGLDELSKIAPAARRLTDPQRWGGVLQHSAGMIRQRPAMFTLTLALAAGLVAIRRRLIRHLVASGKRVRWSFKGHIGTTFKALVMTLAASAAFPSLIWLAAIWIGDPLDEQRFGLCVAAALSGAAMVLFTLGFLANVCRPSGLGETHLRWHKGTCELIRRELRWFVPTIVPLAFLSKLTWQRAGITYDDALARAVGLIALVVLSLALHRVFRPKHGVVTHHLETYPTGWLNRTRNLWYPTLVLIPIALGIMGSLGYTYTASQLISRISQMMMLAIGITVGYGVLLRALYLGERRLALEKLKDDADADRSESLGEDEVLDVARLSAQTRALIRLILIVVVTASLLVLWIDVLPVLRQFQRIPLISLGTEVQSERTVELFLTLGDVLASILIFAATFLISRNLTGTLELVLLRRLPMSPGARYATETIAKYMVVIVGLVAGFDRLGIGWDKVQFLAAAVSVGLGFGLQEIFANFVSGLIILFERPIRVGDTVTIGTITGEVTRIRMRATTITDWDRKELIIPNREFVTGQVINWTLSDAVMRCRINVGIAYGSDTATARKILERLGRENPRVLATPELDVRFIEFGDSSLNFQLRVYVREIDDYIPVMDELHDAIDQAFREAKVEIAFPQRDLHIRTAEAPIEVKDGGKRASRRPRIEELPDPSSM